MASFAMRRTFERRTSDILGVGNRLDMIWTGASAIAAEMIHLLALGDRSYEMLISDAMRCVHPVAKAEDSVAAGVPIGHPFPTAIR